MTNQRIDEATLEHNISRDECNSLSEVDWPELKIFVDELFDENSFRWDLYEGESLNDVVTEIATSTNSVNCNILSSSISYQAHEYCNKSCDSPLTDSSSESSFSPTTYNDNDKYLFSIVQDDNNDLSKDDVNWTIEDVEKVIKNSTDPIGKFLRELKITATQALRLGLMPLLNQAPRKPRGKYGPRKKLTSQEKMQLSKERNREHARATRLRKRVFKELLSSSSLRGLLQIRDE